MKAFALCAAAALLPGLLAAQSMAPADSTPMRAPAPDPTLPLKHAPQPTGADITAADLMTRLYIYADDSLQGREAGTVGNTKATDYIAAQVKKIGLQPAGENGTYFQTLPFKTRTIDSASSLTAGGTALELGREWAATGTASGAGQDMRVIYAGELGDSSFQLGSDQVRNHLVIFALPRSGRGSLRRLGDLADSAGAIAVVVPDRYMAFFSRPGTFVDDPDRQSTGPSAIVMLTADGAARLLGRPMDQVAPGDSGVTASLDLRLNIQPVEYPARNVVAILPGNDPALRNQYVAIGAHNDHIGVNDQPVDHDSLRLYNHLVRPGGAEDRGARATPAQQAEVNRELAAWRAKHPAMRPDSIDNGADDDGSGTVTVLEIAQKMASLTGKNAPRRSILFVWHVGEEKGLLGSAWFTDHPTVPRDSIVAQLNMDMVGRGDTWDETGKTKDGQPLAGAANYLQIVGSRRLSTELGDLIERVNTEDKHGLVFDYAMDANGHPMNIYCRSDHYEYARYGIPIAFFTTGGHSDYHQVTDEPQYIDYPHMARIGNLVEDVALHIANLDHRLVVDQPKPDPNGGCRQ